MATSSVSGSSQRGSVGSTSESSGKLIQYDHYIDSALRKTRRQVRNVDLAGGLMLLGAGTLGYFLLVALLDHWVVTGGLGSMGRWLALVVFLVAACGYAWRCLLPPLLRRVNPVYAAHSIERIRPMLKNSLVNFLLFRANPTGLTQPVYEAIEEQAATNLAQVAPEAAIDRSKLIKIGYLFLTVLLLAGVYKVISPKDPLRTVGRVILPWADINPPTRVTIAQVQPGDATVFRGQQVPISAEVLGLADGKPVTLLYSTADGQLSAKPLPMQVPADGYFFQCELPEGRGGVQQELTYQIVAGDAVSHTYRLQVQPAPTMIVQAVDYDYPSYTGLVNQSLEQQGDVKAIEGTQVTLRAEANQPIKTAAVDFDCDGTLDQRMTFDGRQASVSFTLALKEDRKTPEHSCYQLRFTSVDGQENIQPIRHQIEVTPDVAPEIQLLAPKKDQIEVPLNAAIAYELSANDPDYALAKVGLVGKLGQRQLFDNVLLDESRAGQFSKKLNQSPKKLGLKQGDVLEYWAYAEDNKSPAANRSETPHRRVRIGSPVKQQPNQDQLAQNDPEPNNGQRKPPDGQPNPDAQQNPRGQQDPDAQDQPQPNPEQAAADRPQDPRQQPGERDDPQRGQGDRQQGNAGPQDQPNADREPADAQDGQPGDKQPADPDESQPGQNQPGAGGQSDQPQPGDQPGQAKQRPEQAGGGQSAKPDGDKPQAGQRAQSKPDEPVANDGSQDGAAFEKILNREGEKDPNLLKPQEDKQQPGNQGPDQQNKQIQGDQHGGQKPQEAGNETKPSDQNGDGQAPQNKFESGQGGNDSGQKAPQGAQGSAGGAAKPGGSATGDQNDQTGKGTGEKTDQRPAGKPEEGTGPDEGGEATSGQPPKGDAQGPQSGQAEADRPQPDKQGAGSQSRENTGEDTRGGAQAEKKAGQGDRSQGSTQKPDKNQPGGQQRPDAKGGDEEHDKGDSGAGRDSTREKTGSPPAQGANRQRDKTPSHEKNSDSTPNDSPPSPSNSERQSDSKGDQAGDRSGGGDKGGGQKANQAGTGGAGKNTQADEGGGTADDRGEGDTSDRAGEDRAAAEKTGKSGEQAGQGSDIRDRAGQAGGGRQQPGGQGQKPEENRDQQTGGPQQGPGSGGRGAPAGGGNNAGETQGPPPPAVREQADEANLEFTRKATDLALERLKDQLSKGQTDQQLLDRLGWSQDELAAFVRRWEAMRRQANAQGPEGRAARTELDAALRSLGLRPRGTQIKNNLRDDQTQRLKESRRTRPPNEYLEQYRAYTQGTSRVRPSADKAGDR